jgi:hypothetical protein
MAEKGTLHEPVTLTTACRNLLTYMARENRAPTVGANRLMGQTGNRLMGILIGLITVLYLQSSSRLLL